MNSNQKNKYARLGKPSLIFGWGQEKRFSLIERHLDLKRKKVLDIGCGTGIYSGKFLEKGANVFGVDVDKESILQARRRFADINFKVARSEALPFDNDFFDVVFLHEVLEHVEDDEKTIQECLRVLKKRGKVIIFAPNRLFPFETHGCYIKQRYIFGNIPLLSWAPWVIRKQFCPHVRIYTVAGLKRLFRNQNVSFQVTDFVWPAFDKIEKRFPHFGKALKHLALFAEKNWFLKRIGISIFMIVLKK